MKNRRVGASVFDQALKGVCRDFAREMGFRAEVRIEVEKSHADMQGMFAEIGKFIKSKMQRLRTLNQGRV